MSIELKPCPFCGASPEARWSQANPKARCRTEGCKGSQLPVTRLDDPEDIAAWNTRAAIQQAEAKTDESAAVRNPFASRCYTMSESHLSGHRLIVGFEKSEDAQDAHEWVARQGRGDFTHPAPGVPDGYALVPTEPTEEMLLAYTGGAITDAGFRWCRHQWSAMLAAAQAQKGQP